MKYLIHAPGMGRTEMDAATALGLAAWLAMQAPKVKDLAVHQLNQLLLQPQIAQSDVLIAKADGDGRWVPSLWLSYAHFSAEFERDYMQNPSLPIPSSAWASGDRLWGLNLLAPSAFDQTLLRLLQDLFAGKSLRSISPVSHRMGQRVVIWRGSDCSRIDAKKYWQERPILA
jgi:hemolysin-activating ACP:hemolysin acyltransferase